MMRLSPAPVAMLAALVLVAGCKAPRGNDYPSLLPRPIEKRGFADPMPKALPPAAPDPALDREIAASRAALVRADEAFAAKAAEAERLAGRANDASPGSDAWITAQVALAELDTLRSGTAGILADIEQRMIDRAAAGEAPYPGLQTLLEAARAQNAGEVARVGRVEAMTRRA